MNEESRILFQALADLSLAQREECYARMQAPASVRAEIESLLNFDGVPEDCLSSLVHLALQQLLSSLAQSKKIFNEDP